MSSKKIDGEDNKPDFSTTGKVIKTIFLILAWVSLGLHQEITGPTLKDLIIKTQSNYELIARGISGKSVGYFVGAIIGGPTVDKFRKYCDLILAICLSGAAVALFVTPYFTNVTAIWFPYFFRGICGGVQNIAGQTIVFNLWQDKSAGPLHIVHFGYGVGSFIVPQIANPFLAVPYPRNFTDAINNQTNTTNVTSVRTLKSPVYYIKESRIEIAYLIVTIIVASVSMVFVIYQFCFRRNTSREVRAMDNTSRFKRTIKLIDPGTCANGDRLFGIKIFIFLFCFFFVFIGGEKLYGNMIRSYAIDQLSFSGDDGSLLNTVFWISHTAGRFIGFFTGTYIPIDILILIETLCLLVTTIFLEIFARGNSLALWILTVPMGIFISPLYPSGIAWGDFHLKLTGSAITFVIMGSSSGALTSTWIIGYLYEHHGPEMFVHQAMFYSSLLVCLTVAMTIIGKLHGGRFDSKQEDNDDSIDTNKDKSDEYRLEKYGKCDGEEEELKPLETT